MAHLKQCHSGALDRRAKRAGPDGAFAAHIDHAQLPVRLRSIEQVVMAAVFVQRLAGVQRGYRAVRCGLDASTASIGYCRSNLRFRTRVPVTRSPLTSPSASRTKTTR